MARWVGLARWAGPAAYQRRNLFVHQTSGSSHLVPPKAFAR